MHGFPSRHARGGSQDWVDDVDPRFAEHPPVDSNSQQDQHTALPSALTPGANNAYRMPSPTSNPPIPSIVNHSPSPTFSRNDGDATLGSGLGATMTRTDNSNSTPSLEDRADSNENLPTGMRSPTGSDTSHFTSISQRGINPAWRPGPGSNYGAGSTASAAQRRREDVILTANPDFSLPGMTPGRGRGRGRGIPRGRAMTGLTPAGRYPTEI